MGSKRQYTAIFAIGAKLLGSFKGAISAAQSRLRGLEKTALSAGKSVLKFGSMFTTVFAGLAAFGVGAIFKKIFEGADEAAQSAEQRTRTLTAALMAQNYIRARGRDYAAGQVAELYKHNEALAAQGVISKQILDAGTAQLAVTRLGPREIAATMGPLADTLVAMKGINATQEDMTQFAKGFGVAVQKGMTKPLTAIGIVFSDAEQKWFKGLSKQERFNELTKRILKFGGESARALKTPEGRIHALDNMIALMQLHMGEASLESRAKMADAWRGLLPKIEPFLTKAKIMTADAMASIANYIGAKVVPALEALSKWAHGAGGKAFDNLKKAWGEMVSSIGPAFLAMFKSLGSQSKTFGQLLGETAVKAMNALAKAFIWIGKNAKWLVPTVIALVAAFAGLLIALEVAAAIAAIANPVSLIIIGIGALVAAILVVIANWNTLKEMFPKTTAVVEHMIEGFKLSFKLGFDTIVAIWKTVVAIFTGDFTGVGEAWKKVWKDTAAMAGWWKTTLVEIAKVVGQAFKDYFLRVFEDIKKIWTWMKGFSWEGIKKMFSEGQAAATAYGQQMGGDAEVAQAYFAAHGGGGGAAAASAAGVATGGGAAPAHVPLTPEATAKVTAERADILADLARPEIRNLVSATLAHEMSSAEGQKDVMESLVNRAIAYKKAGKDYRIESLIKGGFYGPYNRGETQATMAKGLSDARSQQVAGFIQEMNTRNVLRGMTDQGEVPKGYTGPVERIHGELYSYAHGYGGEAYTQSQKAAQDAQPTVASAHALGGIFNRHHIAHIAEAGPEAVIPLAGGGRARGLLAAASRALGVGGGGSSSTAVNFAPNITIHGGASAKEQDMLDGKLRDLARDFVDHFTRAQRNERRLSYEGGYG